MKLCKCTITVLLDIESILVQIETMNCAKYDPNTCMRHVATHQIVKQHIIDTHSYFLGLSWSQTMLRPRYVTQFRKMRGVCQLEFWSY